MFKPLVGGVAAATLAITGLGVVAGSANAAQHHDATHILVTPPEGLLDTSQSGSTGHNDFLENGLHVWTEGSGSTDKAAGYLAQAGSLLDLANAGEPNLDWSPTSPSLPQAPGEQIVVDFDGNGTPDGILVGEPAYYGNVWWLSNSAPSWVKEGAPHQGGGYGSPYYGTLAEWANDANFPDAKVTNVGYSMGSGVHGDGVINSMTFGDVTYTFALGLGPCDAIVDPSTQTYTLSQDCSTTETINVPDGWTVDGAGNTITAVEDADNPTFPGAVIQSATGDDTQPASMNIENLHVTTQGFDDFGQNSGGKLAGIRYDRAGGSVTNVSIDGISHGNGVQEGNALYVRNRDASGNYTVPRATVTVDNLTVTNYQKTGVIFDGNVGFTMTNSTVGSAGDADGNPLTSIAANAVQVSRDAQGTISGSTIGLNEYNPNPPPGDGSDATGILLYDSKTVTVNNSLITGGNGDVGVDAYNDTQGVLDTHLIASCDLFSRSESGNDPYDPYGVGIAQWSDGSTPVEIDLSDSTFSGWTNNTGLLTGTPPNLQVVPGATNQHLGQCPPSAPTNVTVPGGDQQTDVNWSPSTAPAYAPLEGYTVTAKDPNGDVVATQNVGPDATSAHLTGLTSGQDYTISVVANSEGGTSIAGTAVLYATSITLTADPDTIVWGNHTTLTGTLVSNDPNAVLTGRQVTIQSSPKGTDNWTTLTTASADANGGFTLGVSPTANTDYRAIYAGQPDNSSTSDATTVDVALKVSLRVGHKHGHVGGRKILFSGVVSPNDSGNTATLEYQHGKNGTWTVADTQALDDQSSFGFKWLPDEPGKYFVQVLAQADATHVDGASSIVKVTIK